MNNIGLMDYLYASWIPVGSPLSVQDDPWIRNPAAQHPASSRQEPRRLCNHFMMISVGRDIIILGIRITGTGYALKTYCLRIVCLTRDGVSLVRAPLDILEVEDLHCRSLGAVSLSDREARCLTADHSPWLYEQYQSRKVAGPRPNLRKVAAYGHRLVVQMVLAVAQYQSDLGQTQSQGCPHG